MSRAANRTWTTTAPAYLTRREAADELRCSLQLLDRLLRTGELRSFRCGRLVRISRQELMRFVKEQEVSRPLKPPPKVGW